MKACQEAFLCARECFDRGPDPWLKDDSCVARCSAKFEVDSPCMERPPAEFGADLAWGCEGATVDTVWGNEYVPGLCRSDAIEVCGCLWDAYECTGDYCPEPGSDESGEGTSDTGDETGTEDTGTDTTGVMDTGTDTTGAMDTGTDTTGTGDTTGGN